MYVFMCVLMCFFVMNITNKTIINKTFGDFQGQGKKETTPIFIYSYYSTNYKAT